jgi:hypothetical protein
MGVVEIVSKVGIVTTVGIVRREKVYKDRRENTFKIET